MGHTYTPTHTQDVTRRPSIQQDSPQHYQTPAQSSHGTTKNRETTSTLPAKREHPPNTQPHTLQLLLSLLEVYLHN